MSFIGGQMTKLWVSYIGEEQKEHRACLEELSSAELFQIDHQKVGNKKILLLKSCLDVTFSSFLIFEFSIMKVGVSLLLSFYSEFSHLWLS